MDQTEKWYQSRGVWGGLIAVVAGIAALFGLTISAEVQVEVVDLLIALGPVIGGALALYGRLKATKRIE